MSVPTSHGTDEFDVWWLVLELDFFLPGRIELGSCGLENIVDSNQLDKLANYIVYWSFTDQ